MATSPAVTNSEFVPNSFDGTAWPGIEPLLRALRERPVRDRAELERWLLDRSELDAACSEAQAILYINMTCNTEDKAAQQAYTTYIETVPPKVKPLAFELDAKQTTLSRELGLDSAPGRGDRYKVLVRDVAVELELFRAENVPIQTELSLLSQRYDQTVGAMTVEFDAQERTMPQMARYMESTDRALRERAWRTMSDRRLRDAEAISDIYDEMIAKRDVVARNAGFADFVGYAFKEKHRFDYGVGECGAFHRACAEHIVPLVRRLDRERKDTLELEDLRPWDLAVDPKGRAPLRPFEGGRQLVAKAVATFDRLDPRLGAMLRSMGDGSNTLGARHADGSVAYLDLDSRKGKAPGGYQYMRDRSRAPFIFMNAAGLQRDVSTMLHEAGHAFHSMLCVDEPLVNYRTAPIEFCEVASMSMELLTMPYWGQPQNGSRGSAGKDDCFYADEAELARARRHQIEGAVGILPWIATIDKFQHWLYSKPDHTRDERRVRWLLLDEEFGHDVKWDGLEASRAHAWQRQMHLFGSPFYYIEYGIAQLGALQLWLHATEHGDQSAVEAYLAGLRLGGSKPLPDLFKASGLTFDFGPEMVKRLVDRVQKELETLPM